MLKWMSWTQILIIIFIPNNMKDTVKRTRTIYLKVNTMPQLSTRIFAKAIVCIDT